MFLFMMEMVVGELQSFEVVKDFRPYSLFSFEFRLPNGADRKVFQITNWDLLFIATPLF